MILHPHPVPAGNPASSLLGPLAAGLVLAAAFPAWGHQAPSGWTYSMECCSGMDCAPAPPGSVTERDGGWLIVIPPGVHDMAPGGWTGHMPYRDKRIRQSADEYFHVCISGTGALLCLYLPGTGM